MCQNINSESFSPSPSRHNPPPGDPDFPNTRLLNIEITRRMNASTDDAIKKKLKYLFELINLVPMEGDRNQMRTFMTIRSVASVSDDKANNPEETVKLLLEFLFELHSISMHITYLHIHLHIRKKE